MSTDVKGVKSFEDAIRELETVVEKLESGEIPLDDSIETFQKGMELYKYCNKRLDEAEKKIVMLLEDEKGDVKEVLMPETGNI